MGRGMKSLAAIFMLGECANRQYPIGVTAAG